MKESIVEGNFSDALPGEEIFGVNGHLGGGKYELGTMDRML